MSVAKVIEISSTSEESFEDAVNRGIARASETLHGITGAWVKEQRVSIRDRRVSEYQVNLLITFLLDEPGGGQGRTTAASRAAGRGGTRRR